MKDTKTIVADDRKAEGEITVTYKPGDPITVPSFMHERFCKSSIEIVQSNRMISYGLAISLVQDATEENLDAVIADVLGDMPATAEQDKLTIIQRLCLIAREARKKD
ncbi:MAG: hypothetical protein NC218_01645 [Acetobacter sp.]|nr:hypothetical protein [Acetobacter sp.]